MSFQDQVKLDNSVFFNTAEFAETATLTTVSGDEYDVKIVRLGQSEFVSADPGQADSDTFEICKVNVEDEIYLSPNDRITTSDEIVWVVQTGIRYDGIGGTWTASVLSDGRIGA